MASVTISNSPVHSESMISYPYGEIDSSYSCGWHTGVDIVPHGTTVSTPPIYPCFNGEIVYINADSSQTLGLQVQIRDNQNRYWRYCHLSSLNTNLQVGDIIGINTAIGNMGDTGNATGIHLHLECSTSQAWVCSNFINPCGILRYS